MTGRQGYEGGGFRADRTGAVWGDALTVERRVALALGTEPIEDARHLLAPVVFPEATPMGNVREAIGPDPVADFLVDLHGASTRTRAAVAAVFSAETRARLDFPRLWTSAPDGRPALLDALGDGNLPLNTLTLAWALGELLSLGTEAERDLHRYTVETARIAARLGWTVRAREETRTAVQRADQRRRLRQQFGRTVEMRLLPQGRPFPARTVWRAAYALGLHWGDFDLFHWHDPASGTRLFTLSGLGQPAYFLPERAAEGEGVAGLSLGFDLPYAPAPLETFDRMAVALAYLREHLPGRPVTAAGLELDADRLYEDRDSLESTIAEMTRAGIPPGSPDAERFF